MFAVHAGLVLMYESGIVALDLADTTLGWLDDCNDGSSQPKSRCEFLFAALPLLLEARHSD